MSRHLLILGGGTAGTIMANSLRRRLPAQEWSITVVDRSEKHLYQPGLLFLPFGKYEEGDIIRSTRDFIPQGVEFMQAEVDRIIPEEHAVTIKDGRTLKYDLLIIATGCRTAPEETAGMLGPKWRVNVHDFYTLDGARALREKLKTFPGGRVVVHINEMPIKCPVAPLEFTFLADTFFRERGMRDKVMLTYVTPLSGAFTKPKASKKLSHLLGDKGIELVTEFVAEKVDQENNKLVCFDGREVPYDLLVTTPTNMGDEAVRRSALGDDLDFIATNKHTLQSIEYKDVFVIGDATNLPASKAGSVAHFESETLADNIIRHIAGEPLKEEFDGHSNCFIESGNGKALLIDFNHEYEPHEGGFPFAFGPMRLLEESRLNHWGKLAFRHIYWNVLLRAWPLPGISRQKKKPVES
ncbi:type III sulfide quinone reductase, selenoprotein subtype [Prosthecobacter vanneervenii]|uniref:Sulfide:quinone oxidoreductase n=1 Tax=Prosthecobacter vanneervenii TaxID=48466 RepID=A0A7W8DKM9_9BACT|nr:FAD/NAD(P)-binding oxidoreductase [Prosthecobacter vanneervenii]MBB5033424.1 sulfide:quinone oxidoreductase [Prosthecobacter vanneervenii]